MLAWQIMLGFFAGIALGVWFFGGLWWTLRRLPNARHPLAWVLASLVVRVSVVGVAMVSLVQQHWLLPAPALVGLIAVRQSMLATQTCPRPIRS